MSAYVGNAQFAAETTTNDLPNRGAATYRDRDTVHAQLTPAARGIGNAVLLATPFWALFGVAVYLLM